MGWLFMTQTCVVKQSEHYLLRVKVSFINARVCFNAKKCKRVYAGQSGQGYDWCFADLHQSNLILYWQKFQLL